MSAYYELPPGRAAEFDLVTAAIESGTQGLLIDQPAMPPEFFDLSTGVAGSIVQRLTMYGIRMAVVVPDPSIHSGPFQDFAREANAGGVFRFFPDREQAVAWLSRE
jgi:PadR family transcriptional regulator AphA